VDGNPSTVAGIVDASGRTRRYPSVGKEQRLHGQNVVADATERDISCSRAHGGRNAVPAPAIPLFR
jgi:hypothetical protein